MTYSQTYASYPNQPINLTLDGLSYTTLNYSLLAYNLQHSTRRDINKRQGQVLELKYSSLPFSDDDKQNLLAMHTRLYFPGMGRHHAIRIDNDVQTKEKGKPYLNNDGQNVYPSFTDYVTFPRGVLPQPNDQLYSFKGDYMLPLLDPDLNIPGVMYLKRISMSVFYDYSYAIYKTQNTSNQEWLTSKNRYESVGTELRAEMHAFRFIAPLTMGYRYAYLPQTNSHFHEFLFGIGFDSLR